VNLLIVEDDMFKFVEISEIVDECLDAKKIKHTTSVHETINYLKNHSPDRILLDMSLPSHLGRPGEGNPTPMPDGGIEVILELRYLGRANIPIIVITQFPGIEIEVRYFEIDEAKDELESLYGIKNLTVTKHDDANKEWKDSLRVFLGS